MSDSLPQTSAAPSHIEKASLSWPRAKRVAMPYLFILPAVCVLLLIFLYPMVRAFALSFQQYDQLFGSYRFIGLENFRTALGGAETWNSLRVSVIWVVGSVVGQFALGLAVALLLHQPWPGNRLVRVLILIPWVMPGLSIGVIWRLIYNPQLGMVNDLFARVGLPPQTWLADPSLAIFAVILPNIWKAFPFVAVTMLAGLAGIPSELYEAAKVDGANVWRRFLDITVPSLRGLIVIVSLLMGVWTFNYFDLPFVLTGGGPARSTEVMPILVYRFAFEQFAYGLASALAVVMTVINLIFAIFYLRGLYQEA